MQAELKAATRLSQGCQQQQRCICVTRQNKGMPSNNRNETRTQQQSEEADLTGQLSLPASNTYNRTQAEHMAAAASAHSTVRSSTVHLHQRHDTTAWAAQGQTLAQDHIPTTSAVTS